MPPTNATTKELVMNLRLNQAHLDLPRQAIVNLTDAAGVEFICESGAVWITLDHDRRDIVLQRGERFTTDMHRPAMVYALKPSLLGVRGYAA
jgi:hypothetical protein